MNFEFFQERFELAFPLVKRWDRLQLRDFCPDVRAGGGSRKIQYLLRIAAGCLEGNECYLEVGAFEGKSMISAIGLNPDARGFACDNFSEGNREEILFRNLEVYGVRERVKLLKGDFRQFLNKQEVDCPVGLFYYDGPHSVEGHQECLILIEPLLSPRAMVVIEHWSVGRTQTGTYRALARVARRWEIVMVLPHRVKGKAAQWHKGIGVFRVDG